MQFMGFDNFIWFTGVVEERNDPLRLGRVKVRMFGLHSAKKVKGKTEGIPTEDLPWAYPMQPITSAAMNGIGTTPLGPVEGTHVVGFFRDGDNCQDPIVMGTLGGYPLEGPGTAGFNDPNGLYPKEKFLKEPDTNRRAVVEFEDPIENDLWFSKLNPLDKDWEPDEELDEVVLRERDEAIQIANNDRFEETGDKEWDEPENPFEAEYPFNHVRESESGHIEEWDDTPDKERLMRWHRSGTFEEIHPDGQKVTKVVRDNYTIISGHDFVHVKTYVDEFGDTEGGNVNVTIDGDCNMRIDGDYNLEVGGDYIARIDGNWDVEVFGNTNIMTVGTKTDESMLNHTIKGAVIHLNP